MQCVMIKNFSDFMKDNLVEGYLRRIISSEINKKERTEDSIKKEEMLKKIKSWLDEMVIKNYNIDEKTLEIDVNGDVNLINSISGDRLPDYIKFRKVTGYFDCSCNKLKSLEGCPDEVGGDFSCSYNSELTSIKHCPNIVLGNFDCSYLSITHLDGYPEKVGGNFFCNSCRKLEYIKGCPKEIGKGFFCSFDNIKNIHTGYNVRVDVYGDFKCFYSNSNNIFKKEDILKYFDVRKNVDILML